MLWTRPDWQRFSDRARWVIQLGIRPESVSPELLRHVRILSGATIGLSVFAGLPWMIQYARLGLPFLSAVLAATVLAALANLVVLRRTLAAERAGHVGVALVTTLLAVSSSATGGLDSPIFAWFLLVPLCAAVIVDFRGATLWTGAMLAMTAIYWGVQIQGWFPPVPQGMSGAALVFDRMLLVLAVGVIGTSFVHAERETARRLLLAKDEAEREATYRELLMHAAVASNEAGSLKQAMDEAVGRICAAMGWVAGAVYRVDEQGRARYGGSGETSDERLRPLAGYAAGRTFEPGAGSIGRAAATGRPQLARFGSRDLPDWILELARQAGLRNVFAVPVLVGGDVRAVLHFALTTDPDDPEGMTEVFSLIGKALGKVEERTRLQDHLRQRQRMEAVGQLAAGIAHEVNNPMAYVRSNLHSLHELIDELSAKIDPVAADSVDLADISSLIEESLEGVERTIQIVRDVREFSHTGTGPGSKPVDWTIVSLAEIADGAHRVACAQAPAGVEFDVVHREAARCSCSPNQISQVVVNLLVNACHAVSEDGRIRLETGIRDGRGFVRVSDDGCGIAVDHQSRLFEPFFTTKGVGEGTGLGLSVSYEIVRAHGGEIHVRSEPGEGATFEVWLPAVAQVAVEDA